MAVFTNSPDDCQRLDWYVLCNGGGIALYWREEYLADDVRWLVAENYDIYEFSCDRWDSEASMYADIERVLRFSEWWGPYWGHNLNALDDCLTGGWPTLSPGVGEGWEQLALSYLMARSEMFS